MKASEIPIGYSVQVRDSLASLVFTNQYIKDQFVERYGDVDVVYSEYHQDYLVPEFEQNRKKLEKVGLEHCGKWGSE